MDNMDGVNILFLISAILGFVCVAFAIVLLFIKDIPPIVPAVLSIIGIFGFFPLFFLS